MPTQGQQATQSEWRPPAWLVQTFIDSGHEDMLHGPPAPRPTPSAVPSSGDATHIPPTNAASPSRPRQGNDEISLTQAVDRYCAEASPETDAAHEGNDLSQEDISEPTDTEVGEVAPPDCQAETQPTPEQAHAQGIYRGYVQLCHRDGQSYFDLGNDPNEDSSWFEEMIKPLEEDERTTVYPMQGANWGMVC